MATPHRDAPRRRRGCPPSGCPRRRPEAGPPHRGGGPAPRSRARRRSGRPGQGDRGRPRFGRWLLVEIFAGDASAALDERSVNPMWLELTRRAGGPTLEISRRVLSVAVRVVAFDKRITDPSWQRLDLPRKETLARARSMRVVRGLAQRLRGLLDRVAS